MDRVVKLDGGRNFRDLGGYPAASERTVRWGVLYRSGTLHALTPDDMTQVQGLGIRLVCDFRAPEERAEQPTNWPDPATEIMVWDDRQEATHRGFARRAGETMEDGRAAMLELYPSLVEQHGNKFRALFQRLVEGDVPVVFHCSAGKDRTGIAAALILTALGVPREIILEDYAMSENVVDYMTVFQAEAARNPDSMIARYMTRPRDYVAAVVRSDVAYLNAALEGLEQRHGSVEGYIESVLGVGDAEIAKLRDQLLE